MSQCDDERKWGEECSNCGARFPVLHGPHPTWVPCVALAGGILGFGDAS